MRKNLQQKIQKGCIKEYLRLMLAWIFVWSYTAQWGVKLWSSEEFFSLEYGKNWLYYHEMATQTEKLQLKLVLLMVRQNVLEFLCSFPAEEPRCVLLQEAERRISMHTTWQLKKLRLENTLPGEKQTLMHTLHWNLSQTVVVLPCKTITVISVHLEQCAQQYGSCLLSWGSCTWQRPQSAIKGYIKMCNDLLCPSPVLWHPSVSRPVLLSDAVCFDLLFTCVVLCSPVLSRHVLPCVFMPSVELTWPDL